MTVQATSAPETIAQTMKIVVFRVGRELYGMPIGHIREVVLTPNVTRMPQTEAHIEGVANIRGNIIAIFNLEKRFNMATDDKSRYGYTLVVESEEFKVGLLVREVPATISINSADIDTSMQAGMAENGSYITGIVKSGSDLIMLMDVFKLVGS